MFTEQVQKRSGRTKKPHDFLGNTRLDKIEGLFRRTEVIHGDKRLPVQIKRDKKRGFTQSKGTLLFSNNNKRRKSIKI